MCIDHLKKRLFTHDGFPHEIGAFLGYPLEDVRGFINIKDVNVNIADYGKYIVMKRKPESCLRNCKNVPESMLRYLPKGEVYLR